MTIAAVSAAPARAEQPLKLSVTPAPRSALLVQLDKAPDFAAAANMGRGVDRKVAAWSSIVDNATTSQKQYVAIAEKLKSQGALTAYETLMSPNMLVLTPAEGKSSDVLKAFQTKGVSAIYDNGSGRQLYPAGQSLDGVGELGKPWWGLDVGKGRKTVEAPQTTPYGVKLVGAPEAWAKGADGRGLVFGSIDTGADHTHDALKDGYRGTKPDGTFDHDYNWIDLARRPSPSPVDPGAHGTHTIGSATGKTVGVAPGAKWISAHGLTGTVDAALKSIQWMMAPTKQDGSAPDPTKAADVVGMSWWMGSSSSDLFHESMRNLRAAGIVPVKSAGNKGPAGGSVTSPGQYPEILATAAVDEKGNIARFSSRGPAPYPKGSTTPKPDFAAPGADITSTVPGNRYSKMSGTSMAQPHLSGALLAILSKYPQLDDQQLEQVLRAGAVDGGAKGFDPEFGHGTVNIPASLAAAEALLAPKGRTRAA